jgi:hypothetical protein
VNSTSPLENCSDNDTDKGKPSNSGRYLLYSSGNNEVGRKSGLFFPRVMHQDAETMTRVKGDTR